MAAMRDSDRNRWSFSTHLMVALLFWWAAVMGALILNNRNGDNGVGKAYRAVVQFIWASLFLIALLVAGYVGYALLRGLSPVLDVAAIAFIFLAFARLRRQRIARRAQQDAEAAQLARYVWLTAGYIAQLDVDSTTASRIGAALRGDTIDRDGTVLATGDWEGYRIFWTQFDDYDRDHYVGLFLPSSLLCHFDKLSRDMELARGQAAWDRMRDLPKPRRKSRTTSESYENHQPRVKARDPGRDARREADLRARAIEARAKYKARLS